jgi:hypothetical protein
MTEVAGERARKRQQMGNYFPPAHNWATHGGLYGNAATASIYQCPKVGEAALER